ncbi:MAG: sigma-E factor negative regulatory protein [Steroidobacteraceae bacterium]
MTDVMQPNEALQSQLSAFVDDELPTAETDLLVRRLVKDTDLKQTMSRYLMMGEALRNPATGSLHSPILSHDFSQRIASALEQDQLAVLAKIDAHPSRTWPQWLKPAVGMALAASVAAVAIVNLRGQPENETQVLAAVSLQPLAVTAQRPNPANSYVVPVTANAPSAPIPMARLTNYVMAHSEFSSPLGRRNTLTGLLVSEQQAEQSKDTALAEDQMWKTEGQVAFATE